MVDYNQSLSVAETIDRVRVLHEESLFWIDEPTRVDDFEGHARIAEAARTPIQLGENWCGPHDMTKSLAAQASDHVMLDVMKLGGVSGWLRAASLAEASGLTASSHTFSEFSAHLLGITPTGLWLEYLDHVGTILMEPVRIKDGHALMPDRPGSGLEWNEEVIQRWLAQCQPLRRQRQQSYRVTIQTLMAAKQDGQWRIALFQNTLAQFHGRPELVQELTEELRQLLK